MKRSTESSVLLTRVLLLILSALMILSLFACKGGENNQNSNPDDTTPDTPPDDGGTTTPPDDGQTQPPVDSGNIPEPTVLSFEDFVSTLGASPFRDNITTKRTYGISDATVVGVDKNRFENEILYPFPADSEFAKIVNVTDHGFGANKSADENSAAISAALNQLKTADGKKKLVLPEGTFKLSKTVTISGFEDLYVAGSNTTLMYVTWTQGIVIGDSENVHISNITITFETPSMITGKVVKYDEASRTVTFEIISTPSITSSLYKNTVFGYYDLEWSEADQRYYIDTDANVRYYVNDKFAIDSPANNTVKVTFSSDPKVTPVKDSLVSITLESYNEGKYPFTTNNSKNVYFENIGVNSNPGMGFTASNSENIYVNRLVIYPDMERKLYTATSSDGIHTINIRGDFVLTNSIVDGTQDDCLNVCAKYDKVRGGAAANRLNIYENSSGIKVGDTIEIYNPNTMAFHGSYTVKEINGRTLTLDKIIDMNVTEGFLVGNVSGATHLTIDNCIFANTYSRGGLIQCRDTKIINSSYYNMTLIPLLIHSTNDNFGEAIMPKNITVENCKFYKCNTNQAMYASVQVITHNGNGGTTSGTLTDVNIKNCFFGETGGSAVLFYGTGNCSLTNNLMYNLNRVKRNDWAAGMCNCAIGIRSSENITIKNNYAYITGSTPTFEMIAGEGITGLTEEKNVLENIK